MILLMKIIQICLNNVNSILMALESSSGGMYIKREISTIEVSQSRSQNVCFVCGNVGHNEQYWLRGKPNPANNAEPYFPFLETHEPPVGYKQTVRQDSLVKFVIPLENI